MDEEYKPPTKEEFRALLTKWELSGSKAADLVGLNSGRMIRNYTSGKTDVPYAVLFTFFAKMDGKFISKEWRKDVD